VHNCAHVQFSVSRKDAKAQRGKRGKKRATAASLPVLLNGENLLDRRQQEGLSSIDGQTSLTKEKDVDIDFKRQSAALQPDRIVDSACQFCNSLCRLKVHMKSGRVIDILGEPDDPVMASEPVSSRIS
jgi:formate dehydrogenase (coenzyme F420) alpha subunit